MEVNRFQEKNRKTNRVDIYYGKEDEEIHSLFSFLEEKEILAGTKDGVIKKLKPADIFYFEAVDKKCFACLQKDVYQVELTLKEVEEAYGNMGFLRISKSIVLNIYKVDSIQMGLNMRISACLENKESVIINRSYRKQFNQKLMEFYQMKGGKRDETD